MSASWTEHKEIKNPVKEKIIAMNFRATIVRKISKALPIPLRGDAALPDEPPRCKVSCIINFYGRLRLMENILSCLCEQTMAREAFEVILVEDRRGTEEGRKLAEQFSEKINVRYFPLPESFGTMGYSRNYGLDRSHGTYVLLLDDDTVILQKDFLTTLVEEFERSGADAVIPQGMASFCIYPSRYCYHDPYFPSSRCTAYRQEVLRELGGFVSSMIGQEDVEFTFRFIAAGKRYHRSERLLYFHPPLIIDSPGKAKAVGLSFAGLKDRYPLPLWVLLLFNGLRFLPFLLFPLKEEWKMMGRFSLGFLMGIVAWIKGEQASYR